MRSGSSQLHDERKLNQHKKISNMTIYHFKMNCGDSIMNGTKVTAMATSERQAKIKILEAILTATCDLKIKSLELIGTGTMAAQEMARLSHARPPSEARRIASAKNGHKGGRPKNKQPRKMI
jgi:hypothetical protein